jgi:DNA-binding response OmpR family regulator
VTLERGAPIVLVEDSGDDAFFVRRALESVRIANPLVVFETAERARHHFGEARRFEIPALFIVDVSLVGSETGIDFLRWVRQQRAPLGTTPAMMLTGSTSARDQDAAEMLASAYFLIKPVTAETLTSAVQSLGFAISGRTSDVQTERTIERPR